MTPDERFDRIEAQTEKNTLAIRDLILVARTCLDSIKAQGERHDKDHERVMAEFEKVREAQAATDEKLNILIDTVDRIIRHRENGSKGSGD